MSSTLGGDVFWRYWREGWLEVIKDSGDYCIVAVSNKSGTTPPALEIFLKNHLRGSYVGIGKEKAVTPQRHLATQLFRLPQSEEIETIKHPFISRNDTS